MVPTWKYLHPHASHAEWGAEIILAISREATGGWVVMEGWAYGLVDKKMEVGLVVSVVILCINNREVLC